MTPPVAVPSSLQPGKHPYWATRCHDCTRMGATRHLVSPSQTPESASRPVLCATCAERWVAEGRPEALFLTPHGTYNHYRANAGKDKQLAYAAILDNNTGYFAKDRRRKNKSIEKKTRADARRQKKLREQLERDAGKRLREQERHLKAMSIAALRAELGQWGVPLVGKKAELLALLREARKTHPVVVSVPLAQDHDGGSEWSAHALAILLEEDGTDEDAEVETWPKGWGDELPSEDSVPLSGLDEEGGILLDDTPVNVTETDVSIDSVEIVPVDEIGFFFGAQE
eukprot:COSAG03_NODE_5777_length_1176_cov_0.874652_1_plen_283_part_10